MILKGEIFRILTDLGRSFWVGEDDNAVLAVVDKLLQGGLFAIVGFYLSAEAFKGDGSTCSQFVVGCHSIRGGSLFTSDYSLSFGSSRFDRADFLCRRSCSGLDSLALAKFDRHLCGLSERKGVKMGS